MNRHETILHALWDSDARDDEIFCHFIQSEAETILHYGDLRRETSRYAGFFRAGGVQPGEVVFIILRHSPDLLSSFLGAMSVGAIPSFMPVATSKQDPRLYWSSHQKLFARVGAGTLLAAASSHSAIRENLPDLPLRLLAAEDAARAASQGPVIATSPGATAFLQHSSGTTGLKKGVALSHTAVLTQIASYARSLDLSRADRIVSWLPLYHDMGLIACFLLPLITRTPVVMLDPFEWVVNPVRLFEAIKRHRGTLCWQPNFAFHHLCRTVRPSPQLDLSSMRAWIDCSEPCRAETVDLFTTRFAKAGVNPLQFQVCYAMAETVFAVTQTPLHRSPRVLTADPEIQQTENRVQLVAADSPHQTFLSAGFPIAGLQVRIVDARGENLPERTIGEIAITGDCLFSGYYKLDAETRRKLRDGWYHSGDLGFLHNGELYVTGRTHDLIIVHGRNFYAHELEFIVNQTPGAHPGRTVATGWFRPEIGSEEVVIIAEHDGADLTDYARLIHDIKQLLLTHANLQVFDVHVVPPGWLVKTTSGKLSRSENLNKYLAALAESQARPAA